VTNFLNFVRKSIEDAMANMKKKLLFVLANNFRTNRLFIIK